MYDLDDELERLTQSAGLRRGDLLASAKQTSRRRKALTVGAGILALTSAATIATAINIIAGKQGAEITAAVVAALAGTISLVVTTYYDNESVVRMYTGSSKYLSLRDAVFRVVIDSRLTDEQKFAQLETLQNEYAKLDEMYSQYFTVDVHHGSRPPDHKHNEAAAFAAAQTDIAALHRIRTGLPVGQDDDAAQNQL